MLNCKDATRKISEAQDRSLSLVEKLQLKIHLAMCSGCSNFGKQVDFLRTACKRYPDKLMHDSDHVE